MGGGAVRSFWLQTHAVAVEGNVVSASFMPSAGFVDIGVARIDTTGIDIACGIFFDDQGGGAVLISLVFGSCQVDVLGTLYRRAPVNTSNQV